LRRGAAGGRAAVLSRRLGPARPAAPRRRPTAAAALVAAARPGRAGLGTLAGAGSRHLGGARGAAALPPLQAHVLGGAGPRDQAGGARAAAGAAGALAPDARRDPPRDPGPGL